MNVEVSPIQTIPNESLVHIFSFLPAENLFLIACVQKSWQEILAVNELWKPICERLVVPSKLIRDQKKCRKVYRQYVELKRNCDQIKCEADEKKALVKFEFTYATAIATYQSLIRQSLIKDFKLLFEKTFSNDLSLKESLEEEDPINARVLEWAFCSLADKMRWDIIKDSLELQELSQTEKGMDRWKLNHLATLAARAKEWTIIEKFTNLDWFKSSEATYCFGSIFTSAVEEGQIEIVKILLKSRLIGLRDYAKFNVYKARLAKRWDILTEFFNSKYQDEFLSAAMALGVALLNEKQEKRMRCIIF